MSKKALIYVIEDEPDLGQLICSSLSGYHFETRYFCNGNSALTALPDEQPELCLVDLNLPDMDGIELVKQLQNLQVGIIIVSGRDALTDRVLGLELGADDYLTKPFEPRELVARVQSLLRRMQHERPATEHRNQKARFAGWIFHPESLSLANQAGTKESLSRAEGDMLLALLKHPYQILSRDQLLGDNMIPYDRSIDVRMSRLRKKLDADADKPALIKTVYGAGYMLMCDVNWD